MGRATRIVVFFFFAFATSFFYLSYEVDKTPASPQALSPAYHATPPRTPLRTPSSAEQRRDRKAIAESNVPHETKKDQFLRNTRTTFLRRTFWPGQSKPEIEHLFASEQYPETVAELFNAATQREDLSAIAMLIWLQETCEVFNLPTTHAETIERDSLALTSSQPPEIAKRLQWISEDEQRTWIQRHDAACSISEERLKIVIYGYVGATGITQSELEESDRELALARARRKLADAGVSAAQYGLAKELLNGQSITDQAEGLRRLEQAAATIPAAKAEWGLCLLQGCANTASDPEFAKSIVREAALDGDESAISYLGDTNDDDAAGWREFRKALNEDGCLGVNEYMYWATRDRLATKEPASSTPSAHAASQAQTEKLLEELPRTKQFLGCI